MTYLKRIVVVTLLAVWTFPAISEAHSSIAPANVPASSEKMPARSAPPAAPANGEGFGIPRSELVALADSLSRQTETTNLAAREKQAPNLQDFKGGSVSIYIGSGASLVLIIVLLLILF
jgi:hypothetical protein